MLTLAGLTKRFGGFTALNAVAFDVHEGEILGLIGPNGSGKTTAFNSIGGGLDGPLRFLPQDFGCAGKAGARTRPRSCSR